MTAVITKTHRLVKISTRMKNNHEVANIINGTKSYLITNKLITKSQQTTEGTNYI